MIVSQQSLCLSGGKREGPVEVGLVQRWVYIVHAFCALPDAQLLFQNSPDNAAEKMFSEMEKKDGASYDAMIQGLMKVQCTWLSLVAADSSLFLNTNVSTHCSTRTTLGPLTCSLR